MKDDTEWRSFEVDKVHQIVKSKDEGFLILNKDYTIFPEQNCVLKCYNLKEEWDEICKRGVIPYSQGYRFDSHNHNWIFMKEFVNYSFSYMTFVIQEKILKMDSKESIETDLLFHDGFDIEAFNYILD